MYLHIDADSPTNVMRKLT